MTNVFILKKKITLKIYFLSAIFKSSLGNSNWFAFTIIIFYYYSYLSFIFVEKKIFIGIIIINILCLLHSIIVYNYFYPGKKYAVDTILCFIAGFYYSLSKKFLDKVLMNNDISYFSIISVIIYIYNKCFNLIDLINISINNFLFAVLIILITLKVKFINDFLIFCNSHSFSIYLLQRLVLWIVYKKNIFANNDFIRVSFEFTSIFVIASLFDKYTIFIDNFIKKKSKKLEYILKLFN